MKVKSEIILSQIAARTISGADRSKLIKKFMGSIVDLKNTELDCAMSALNICISPVRLAKIIAKNMFDALRTGV